MGKAHYGILAEYPEAYLADLGRVIAAWSHLENTFHMRLLTLMEPYPNAENLHPDIVKMMGISLNRQVRFCRQVVNESALKPGEKKQFDSALSSLVSLRKERDIAGHSQWSLHITETAPGKIEVSQDQMIALFKSWKNAAAHAFSLVPRTSLQETFRKMQVLSVDLIRLLFVEVKASPEQLAASLKK